MRPSDGCFRALGNVCAECRMKVLKPVAQLTIFVGLQQSLRVFKLSVNIDFLPFCEVSWLRDRACSPDLTGLSEWHLQALFIGNDSNVSVTSVLVTRFLPASHFTHTEGGRMSHLRYSDPRSSWPIRFKRICINFLQSTVAGLLQPPKYLQQTVAMSFEMS